MGLHRGTSILLLASGWLDPTVVAPDLGPFYALPPTCLQCPVVAALVWRKEKQLSLLTNSCLSLWKTQSILPAFYVRR